MAYYNRGSPVIHYHPRTHETAELTTLIQQEHYLATYAVFWGGSTTGAFVRVVYDSHERFQEYASHLLKTPRMQRFLGMPDTIYLFDHHQVDNTAPGYIALFV
jgi:hypothetical protein